MNDELLKLVRQLVDMINDAAPSGLITRELIILTLSVQKKLIKVEKAAGQ